MKKSRFQKAIASLLSISFTFMVFSFSLAPKAYAVEYDGQWQIGFRYGYFSNNSFNQYTYQVETKDLPIVSYRSTYGETTNDSWHWYPVFISMPTDSFSSVVKLYASFAFPKSTGAVGNMSATDLVLTNEGWDVTYINSNNQTGYVNQGLESIESYTDSSSTTGNGYAIEAKWQGSEALPIRSLSVVAKQSDDGGFLCHGGSGNAYIRYNSVRVITAEYTAEMEALDGVADAIIGQNEILTALKGDLVAICQDIYQMTGDIYIAQNLLNSYVEELLEKVTAIDANTAEIIRILNAQFAALEVAINNNASTIEAAIEAQTAAMIAYLDEMFNTGNEVPNETYEQQQDAENILDQMESLEKPDVETIVPEIDDYSDGGVSGVMSAIFSSNLIVTMMTLSASLAFGAYVLFGKRS